MLRSLWSLQRLFAEVAAAAVACRCGGCGHGRQAVGAVVVAMTIVVEVVAAVMVVAVVVAVVVVVDGDCGRRRCVAMVVRYVCHMHVTVTPPIGALKNKVAISGIEHSAPR